MDTNLFFDLGVAAVLLLFTVLGAKRGLFKTLTGFLVIVLAIVGAAMLADRFCESVSALLFPYAEPHLAALFGDGMVSVSTALTDALASYGLSTDSLTEILNGLNSSAESLAQEALRSVLQTIVQGALLLVFFLALLLVLKLLVRVLDLVFKLPVLHTLNVLGGAAFGLAEAAALLFLAVYAANLLGSTVFIDHAEGTYLLSFFVNNSPRTLLAALAK